VVTVTYTCPRCDAVVELERGAYLADKCVTPHRLDGWEYLPAYEAEDPGDYDRADGVELVCGAAETRGEGCGEPFYLSFVRFEGGREIDPATAVPDVDFGFLR
jgi:hypothetical protein